MFKAAESERKKRNKPTYRCGNESLFVQSYRLLFLTVSPAIVMRINDPPNLNMI